MAFKSVLVLGATGLLGQAFMSGARSANIDVHGTARSGSDFDLDIDDFDACRVLLNRLEPGLVINCIALVDVAACDSDPGRAYRVNAVPAMRLANWAAEAGARFVHISTDHYFAGEGRTAHDESAQITLLNQYAATKYAGERFALLDPNALVLRTSIVGLRGWQKPTFAEWAIASICSGEHMTLFTDAFTSSIDAPGFARAAFELIERGASGLLHLAASQVYSKEEFIRELARQLDRPLDRVTVGSVSDLTPPRPRSLGLDVGRAERLLGDRLPDLKTVVRSLVCAYRQTP